MKRIILGFILLLSNPILSQNLTLEQFINLQKKDIVGIEESLSSNDWSIIKVEKPTDEKLGIVTFAFEKSTSNDRAQSFLFYYYSDTRNRINIQLHNKEKYNLYLKSAKTLGYALIANKVEDNRIEKVYQNKITTIIISIVSSKDYGSTDTSYHFFIISNDDYDFNFKDEY